MGEASYLVDGVDDPVDSRITTDSLVAGVDKDNFEVLVGRVLVDPVRVENSQIGAATTNSFFGSGAEGSLVLELVHTLVGGLACIMAVRSAPLSYMKTHLAHHR